MSALTKVLIVVLTLCSIFLSGIVVTYVATADNFRQKYNGLSSNRDALRQKAESVTKQLNEKTQEKDTAEAALKDQIAKLNNSQSEIQGKLANAEREKADLLKRVTEMTATVNDFRATNEKQGQTLKATLDEAEKLRADQIKQGKDLDETSAALVEKMAVIDTLQTDKKQLIEQKVALENRLDQLLMGSSKTAVAVAPVTQSRGPRAVSPMTQAIAVKAVVKEVDTQNSLATVSAGAADGVKEGMKFHVTRADQFICDILIINVDTDKSVGVLELVQQAPRVGDNAATEL